MGRWTPADLLADLETALTAVMKSVSRLARVRRPAAEPPAPRVTGFGEYERIEEAKYYPPARTEDLGPEAEPAPSTGSVTRLVLLPVDPYVIHVYWQLAPETLAALADQGVEPRGVLHFIDDNAGGVGDFDVDVDLAAGNWYVRLWSAPSCYRAELALRGQNGGSPPLASSNQVQTPRPWPLAAVEEQFMRVDAPARRAELLPPQEYQRPERAPLALKPFAPPLSAEPVTAQPAVQPAQVNGTAPHHEPPGSAEAALIRRLEELSAYREGPAPTPEQGPAPQAAPSGQEPSEAPADLTGLAESNFEPGYSSILLSGRRPPD